MHFKTVGWSTFSPIYFGAPHNSVILMKILMVHIITAIMLMVVLVQEEVSILFKVQPVVVIGAPQCLPAFYTADILC